MKNKLKLSNCFTVDLMPTVYSVIGLALLFFGLAELNWSKSKDEYGSILLLIFYLITGGVFLMAAGVKKHRGDWATLMGVLLVVMSAIVLKSDLDSIAQGQEAEISGTLARLVSSSSAACCCSCRASACIDSPPS
jgi:uncharacterized membrane protein